MLTHILALCGLAALASAYSFEFTSTPTQCQNVSLQLTGDGGVPPYNVLIVADGNPPGGDEIRKIISHNFTERTTSFNLVWPANAQFVAMISDATGVGSGGTTINVNAASSNDDSCLPTTVTAGFFLFINDQTENVVDQCEPVRISWSPNATAPVTIFGVIPGGNSFELDTSNPTTGTDGRPGITWTPDVPAFTDIIFVANDATGIGVGGSSPVINIGAGDKSCLFAGGPSSTPGTPAGGTYPTSASGSGGSNKVAPIVGGVIGGLAFIILVLLVILFMMFRRRRRQKHTTLIEKPDLADGEPSRFLSPRSGGGQQHLEPTPFVVPPTETSARGSARGSMYDVSSSSGAPTSDPSGATGDQRPFSIVSSSNARSSSDRYSSDPRDRKPLVPPPMRPVNIIQHADAGAAPLDDDEEPDTVELPPAYGNIRRGASTSQRRG